MTHSTVPLLSELSHLLFEQSPEHAFIFLGLRGDVIYWCGAAERILGYRADEIVGQNIRCIFTVEDIERGLPELELEVARVNGQSQDDRWQVRKDGAHVWVTGCVTPLVRTNGELVAFVKILRNRTDQKGQLDAMGNQLDAMARSDLQKNRFLAALGHELRNPLGALVNAVELVALTAQADTTLQNLLAMMRRQVSSISRLVDDLLDTTRISAGKVHLKTETIDLGELLHRAAETCRPQFAARNQAFRIVLPPLPMHVEADPGRLQQVFVNLLSNAAKYTGENGRVWLTATLEDDEAVVRVEDTGIGIAPEMLPKIFDLFTQDEDTREMSPDGLGIGLALARDFVRLHGGKILVRSDGRNKGSEFTVRLPLKRSNRTSSDGGA